MWGQPPANTSRRFNRGDGLTLRDYGIDLRVAGIGWASERRRLFLWGRLLTAVFPRWPFKAIRLAAFAIGFLKARLHVDHHGEEDAADEDAEGSQGLFDEVVGVDEAQGHKGEKADGGLEVGVDLLELLLASVGDAFHHDDPQKYEDEDDLFGQRSVRQIEDRGHEETEKSGIGCHCTPLPALR